MAKLLHLRFAELLFSQLWIMHKFNKGWFHRLQVNFHQSPDGFVAIHAYRYGKGCRYFEVPFEWTEDDDFFGMIYERAQEEWEKKEIQGPTTCPICLHPYINTFHFRYKGHYFCRWCGSHYKIEKGKIVITRRIDQK
jgi:hypothetical protein